MLDDLSLLHALPRSDIQVCHVPLDIGIADNREHLDEAEPENLRETNKNEVLNPMAVHQLNNVYFVLLRT